MALVEFRKMRAKGGRDKALANYIATLQYRGILKKYVNEKGYLCYDSKEFADYKKTAKIGRPIIIKENE